MWKEVVVANVWYYSNIRFEGLRKTTKNISKDSRSPCRDLNLGLPEYEIGMLATFLFVYLLVILHSENLNVPVHTISGLRIINRIQKDSLLFLRRHYENVLKRNVYTLYDH
jgi:hypothetical protein